MHTVCWTWWKSLKRKLQVCLSKLQGLKRRRNITRRWLGIIKQCLRVLLLRNGGIMILDSMSINRWLRNNVTRYLILQRNWKFWESNHLSYNKSKTKNKQNLSLQTKNWLTKQLTKFWTVKQRLKSLLKHSKLCVSLILMISQECFTLLSTWSTNTAKLLSITRLRLMGYKLVSRQDRNM